MTTLLHNISLINDYYFNILKRYFSFNIHKTMNYTQEQLYCKIPIGNMQLLTRQREFHLFSHT